MNETCQHCGAPATTNGIMGQPRCCDQCDNRPMSCDCANRARSKSVSLTSQSNAKAKFPFRVLLDGRLCGEHRTRANADKALRRLVSMAQGKLTTADFVITEARS